MGIVDFIWDYVIPFLFILTILVFVHELGHYALARRNGVRVETFSIGFGPELFGRTDRAGTRWKFSAVPLGGYVKMFGESEVVADGVDNHALTPAEEAVSFHHKTVGQRTAIVLAGPLANFAFAIVVLAVLYAAVGNPMPLAAVGSVQPGSAADEAGLKPGDLILSIDGIEVRWFEDLRSVVSDRPGVRVALEIDRGIGRITVFATAKPVQLDDEEDGRAVGRLGVAPDPNRIAYQRHNVLVAAWMGVERTVGLSGQILAYVGQIISGRRTAEELGGPLRIAQLSGEMAQGGWLNLMFFMAALSINLGLINLFPIPMLDGGHLVFYGVEAVRGRPLGPRTQEYGFRFGLILVLLLMVFATWNDLVHLKVFEFIRELVT